MAMKPRSSSSLISLPMSSFLASCSYTTVFLSSAAASLEHSIFSESGAGSVLPLIVFVSVSGRIGLRRPGQQATATAEEATLAPDPNKSQCFSFFF